MRKLRTAAALLLLLSVEVVTASQLAQLYSVSRARRQVEDICPKVVCEKWVRSYITTNTHELIVSISGLKGWFSFQLIICTILHILF